jgi:protein-disulfide isomerase
MGLEAMMQVRLGDFAKRAAVALILVAAGGPTFADSTPPTSGPAPAQPPAENATLTLPDMTLGSQKAPINLIEYASMTCPHCAHFDADVFPELKKNYIDTGKVFYVFREFPLDGVALRASMVARCMDNTHFFDFIHSLFHTQETWASPDVWNDEKKPLEQKLTPMANVAKQQGGLSREQFDKCVNDQAMLQQIALQAERGRTDFNVPGTPAIYVDGKFFAQGNDFMALDAYLKQLLAQK